MFNHIHIKYLSLTLSRLSDLSCDWPFFFLRLLSVWPVLLQLCSSLSDHNHEDKEQRPILFELWTLLSIAHLHLNCGIWTFNLHGPFSTRVKGSLLTHWAACLAQSDHNVTEAWKPHGIATDNAISVDKWNGLNPSCRGMAVSSRHCSCALGGEGGTVQNTVEKLKVIFWKNQASEWGTYCLPYFL